MNNNKNENKTKPSRVGRSCSPLLSQSPTPLSLRVSGVNDRNGGTGYRDYRNGTENIEEA